MANGIFNNSIAFPRLTNNTTGMFMPVVQDNSAITKNTSVVEKKTVLPAQPKQEFEDKDNTNYWLGCAALAASAIAGIYIYRGRTPEAAADVVEGAVDNLKHPHIKDNFLTALGIDNSEIPIGTREEYLIAPKAGKSGLRHKGFKRVEDLVGDLGLRRTSFEDDKGNVLAEAIRDDKGKVFNYFVKDKAGNIIREYSAQTGITKKFIYDRDNILVREVAYNGKGWSEEKAYNKVTRELEEEIVFNEVVNEA